MPQTCLIVDDKVERRPHQIRDIGGRNDNIVGSLERSALAQGLDAMFRKILPVIGREEGGGPDDKYPSTNAFNRSIGPGLALSIYVQRSRRIALDIGATSKTVENQVAGKTGIMDIAIAAGSGQGDTARKVGSKAVLRSLFRSWHAPANA
eukprot:TRINITY_DN3412_c0_g1_i8.p2 TRINITY_DN3412_c0_g1~~TRINITY_DN3412_c0_g1_i8.p2  ORF type:complete len:150 (-),score=3.70 TRINITY_DN3412_c0_g1_i8:472-921(-)